MSNETVLIVVPGLGDSNSILKWEVNRLNRKNIQSQIHEVPWRTKEESYEAKLKRLLKLMDTLSQKGHPLALLGISAGASFVENAYWERRDQVSAVVSVCGRLRAGRNVFPSINLASRDYKAFKESVLRFEQIQTEFTQHDRDRMLIIRTPFDELVPATTSTLPGAETITMRRVILHNPAITLAMTGYANKILDFVEARKPQTITPV